MSTRHVLKSDGAWVELRDVEDLRARDRKKVDAVIMGAIDVDLDTGKPVVDRGAVAQIAGGTPDAVATVLITSWEIPYLPDAKLPSIDSDVLGDLRLDDYDRLMEIIDPVVEVFMPSRRSTDPDDHDKPSSPSGPVDA